MHRPPCSCHLRGLCHSPAPSSLSDTAQTCAPRPFRKARTDKARAPTVSTWKCIMNREQPASGTRQQRAPRPQAGPASCPGSPAPAGPCRRAGRSVSHAGRRRSARGARNRNCAPSGAGPKGLRVRARHQPRSASPGAPTGRPKRKGGRRQPLMPAQEKPFPTRRPYFVLAALCVRVGQTLPISMPSSCLRSARAACGHSFCASTSGFTPIGPPPLQPHPPPHGNV